MKRRETFPRVGRRRRGRRCRCATRQPSSSYAAAIGPEEALLAVVWPRHERLTDENVPRERQFYSAELREEIRRRHGKGETLPELAQKTGISYASLKGMLNYDKARVTKLAKQKELEGTRF